MRVFAAWLAGFPYRRVGAVCDPRTYSGTIDLELRGNTVSGSTATPALISFTRSVVHTMPAMAPAWQYLHGSTFSVSDPDGTLSGYTLVHPASDPIVGTCPNDRVSEPLGNRFVYNGTEIDS